MICIRSSKNRNKSVFILFLLFSFFTPSQIISCGYSAVWFRNVQNASSMLVEFFTDKSVSFSSSTSLRDIEFLPILSKRPILDTAEMYTRTQRFLYWIETRSAHKFGTPSRTVAIESIAISELCFRFTHNFIVLKNPGFLKKFLTRN